MTAFFEKYSKLSIHGGIQEMAGQELKNDETDTEDFAKVLRTDYK